VSIVLPEVKWFKSSHSSGQTECVEVAWLRNGRVGVRDSKNPAGPALSFTSDAWDTFSTHIRDSDVSTPP